MFKWFKNKKKDNKGFTLVELVIVIAILAILVGLLAPQYTKYVEKSRKAADASNMDEMVKVIKVYAADPANELAMGTYTITIGSTTTLKKDDVLKGIKFDENWITILGIDSADDEYDDVTVEEIYDALMISQYYKSDIPDDIGEIFNWSPDKIRETLPKLTSSMKTSVIIRANELIENGTLDSISRVKAIEESLNCVLASPKDN